jgi:hypothetical protein
MLPTRPPLDPFPYEQHPASRPFGPDVVAGQYVFVQAANETVWVVPETEGHLHPKVLGGATPVAAAGGLLVEAGGVIVEIDNFSGTFRFGPEVFPQVLTALKSQGGHVSSVRELAIEYD